MLIFKPQFKVEFVSSNSSPDLTQAARIESKEMQPVQGWHTIQSGSHHWCMSSWGMPQHVLLHEVIEVEAQLQQPQERRPCAIVHGG